MTLTNQEVTVVWIMGRRDFSFDATHASNKLIQREEDRVFVATVEINLLAAIGRMYL